MKIIKEESEEFSTGPIDPTISGDAHVGKEVFVALQTNYEKLLAFAEKLTNRLRFVASENALLADDVKAALSARDAVGERDPKRLWMAESHAAREATLMRCLESAEIDHAKRMKAAEEGHAERLEAVEVAHAQTMAALKEKLQAVEESEKSKVAVLKLLIRVLRGGTEAHSGTEEGPAKRKRLDIPTVESSE
jgi:hypothetical protein